MFNSNSISDIQERLMELGATTKRKTANAVVNSYVNVANKAFEAVTGGRSNHDPLPGHLMEMAHKFKDQKDLEKVRSQLAGLKEGPQQQIQAQAPIKDRSAFNSFFRQFKHDDESYHEKLKREKSQEEQQAEYVKLQQEKKKEEEKESAQEGAIPKGIIKKNIFGKVKKRATMIETKASSGKQ